MEYTCSAAYFRDSTRRESLGNSVSRFHRQWMGLLKVHRLSPDILVSVKERCPANAYMF